MGALRLPRQQSVYQQLHNDPIGNDAGAHYEAGAKGRKYMIRPANRSFLSDVRAYVCLDGNPELEQHVRDGLEGRRSRTHGLPFLGDNNFLIDRLETVVDREPAHWFERIVSEEAEDLRPGTTRLTVTIDRADLSRTRSALFAPTREPVAKIPQKAWTEVRYS